MSIKINVAVEHPAGSHKIINIIVIATENEEFFESLD